MTASISDRFATSTLQAMSFRDTSGQDQLIASSSAWVRWRWAVMVSAGVIAAAAWLVPTVWERWSAGQSVQRSRLSIATVERGRFERDIAADGRVVAAVSPTLYAAASGTVRYTVQAGHQVQQGQVLGALDSPELQSELAVPYTHLTLPTKTIVSIPLAALSFK